MVNRNWFPISSTHGLKHPNRWPAHVVSVKNRCDLSNPNLELGHQRLESV